MIVPQFPPDAAGKSTSTAFDSEIAEGELLKVMVWKPRDEPSNEIGVGIAKDSGRVRGQIEEPGG